MKRRLLSLSVLLCTCALAVPAPTAHDVAKALVSLGPLDFFPLKTEALNTRHHAMNPTLGLLARTDFRLDNKAIYFSQDIEQKNGKTFKLNGKTQKFAGSFKTTYLYQGDIFYSKYGSGTRSDGVPYMREDLVDYVTSMFPVNIYNVTVKRTLPASISHDGAALSGVLQSGTITLGVFEVLPNAKCNDKVTPARLTGPWELKWYGQPGNWTVVGPVGDEADTNW